MEWYWIILVATFAGGIGALLRARAISRAEFGITGAMGPIFAGLVFSSLVGCVYLFASWIAGGTSLPLVIIILAAIVMGVGVAMSVGGALSGEFGLAAMPMLLLVMGFSIVGPARVSSLPSERAALDPAASERTYHLDCPGMEEGGAQIVFVGRERERDFEVQGYRYRIAGEGEASLSLFVPSGRYRTWITEESNLVVNGQWQSRKATASTYIQAGSSEVLSLLVRYRGSEAECRVPVAF